MSSVDSNWHLNTNCAGVSNGTTSDMHLVSSKGHKKGHIMPKVCL